MNKKADKKEPKLPLWAVIEHKLPPWAVIILSIIAALIVYKICVLIRKYIFESIVILICCTSAILLFYGFYVNHRMKKIKGDIIRFNEYLKNSCDIGKYYENREKLITILKAVSKGEFLLRKNNRLDEKPSVLLEKLAFEEDLQVFNTIKRMYEVYRKKSGNSDEEACNHFSEQIRKYFPKFCEENKEEAKECVQKLISYERELTSILPKSPVYNILKKNEKKDSISTYEKEIITVEKVSTDDMMQFANMPFKLDCPVKKFIKEGGHPFAYMDLNVYNQNIAINELEKLNKYIYDAKKILPAISDEFYIKTGEIAFSEFSKNYGYSRLMCTPYTISGKISKYPLSLSYMTRLDSHAYTANGEIFYNKDGKMAKATVCIWIGSEDIDIPKTGWIFSFCLKNSIFVLNKAETTLFPNKSGLMGTVYTYKEKKLNLDELMKDEENWRREQLGLNPIDYELKKIDEMEGHKFEYWCSELLKKIGYTDIEVTKGSGDQGVDIIAEKDDMRYAIQCKCYSSNLGNKPIQEVNTGKYIYQCHVGVVMTNRYFTEGAINAAKATGVLLWDRDKLIEMLKMVEQYR